MCPSVRSEYPLKQSHLYDPIVLVQTCSHRFGFAEHSSTSERDTVSCELPLLISAAMVSGKDHIDHKFYKCFIFGSSAKEHFHVGHLH